MGLFIQQGSWCNQDLDEVMIQEVYLDNTIKVNWSLALRNLVLIQLIRINSITNTIKTMIVNINIIYVPPGYYTTVPVIDTFAQIPD